MLGAYAMKRVAVGANLLTLGSSSLRNAQTIELTAAWTAIPSASAGTSYAFLQFGARPVSEQW